MVDYEVVRFNPEDQKRYSGLGIATPLKDQVKKLFLGFCDEVELRKLEAQKALTPEVIEEMTQNILAKMTKDANKA